MKEIFKENPITMLFGIAISSLIILLMFIAFSSKRSIDDVAEYSVPLVISETFFGLGGSGSGWFISDDLIITNNHVIETGFLHKIVMPSSGKEYLVEPVATDPIADVAILTLSDPENFHSEVKVEPLTLAPSWNMKRGDKVWAVGNPYGITWVVTEGVVSRHSVLEFGKDTIQISAEVLPGNSGGPLLNENLEVVGMNTFLLPFTAEGKPSESDEDSSILGTIEYAVSSEQIDKSVRDLLTYKRPRHSKLGVKLAAEQNKTRWVLVEESEREGIQKDDEIVSVRTKYGLFNTNTPEDLSRALHVLDPEETVNVTVKRGNEFFSKKFDLLER